MTENGKNKRVSAAVVLLPLLLIFTMFMVSSCDWLFGEDEVESGTKALENAIAEAKGLITGTVESADGSNVTPGSYWATNANIAALQTAIAAAELFLDADATQEEINLAVAALRAAINTFKGQRTFKPTQGDPDDGIIGEITGIITLTNIPAANRPTVHIQAAIDGAGLPYESEMSEISLSGVPGNETEATVSWAIPVYENEEIPQYAYFSLIITPVGTTSSLRIPLMNPDDYDSLIDIPENYDIGFLGTYNIGTVVLSGTITVDIDGTPVPRVAIRAHIYFEDGDLGYTALTNPGANAPWSMVIRSSEEQQSIKFSINGLSNNWSTLFGEHYTPNPEIYALNSNISGININLGTISRGDYLGDLSGTITLTDIKNPKQTVYINAGAVYSEIDLSAVSGTQAELNWSIPVYEIDNVGYMEYFTLEVYESGSSDYFIIGLGVEDIDFDMPINLGTVSLWNPNVPRNLTPLTANQWVNGDITYGVMDWYTISVTPGTYYLWWNDSYAGDYSMSADITVKVFRGTPENLTEVNLVGDDDSAWSSPSSFTVNFTGTVYVRVNPYYGPGTYGIVYSTANTRPAQN